MKPYTYLIRFKPTGQVYYGSRFKNVRLKRIAEDDLMLLYTTSSKYIKKLIKEHGLDAFEWEIRKKFDTPEQAVAWEKKVLTRCKVLEKQDKWLNKNIAGHIIATEESCKKISDANKGKPKSEDHKKKIAASNKGKVKGPQTAEHRKKNSDANSGINNPMYGPCTEERAKNISLAKKGKPAHNKGVPVSDEQKAKQSAKMKGRQLTPDQLARGIAKRTGQKRTPEQKERIRQGVLNRIAERLKMAR